MDRFRERAIRDVAELQEIGAEHVRWRVEFGGKVWDELRYIVTQRALVLEQAEEIERLKGLMIQVATTAVKLLEVRFPAPKKGDQP